MNLVFLLIIYLGLLIIFGGKREWWLEISMIFLIVYNFFIPFFFIILANLVLFPLEKLVQYRYLGEAGSYLSTLSNLKVIGITGSFGKTTAKYVLTEILRSKFNILKTPGSYNTLMGVTKIIRSELKPIHDVFVVEMSAKMPGDIAEICDLVKPHYGLITAIGEQHLQTFGTLENIKKTKNELIKSLPATGKAFFNVDDAHCLDLSKQAHCPVITYGIENQKVDYRAFDLTLNEQGSNFKISRSRDNSVAMFKTSLLGQHNIYNILGAVAIASELGMELSEMVYQIQHLAPVPHRLELKRVAKNIIYIDDAFNSNPVGSQMALKVLKQISGLRKIIVTPGMIELGVKEGEYNTLFGEEISKVCDYVILVGPSQTLPIQDGLKIKQYPSDKIFIADDFTSAKKHLESILTEGDVVLFENDLPDNY
jgi:UDP-N-acetylmuramoyl-tripeptide--D-alanyl-D-alanine ligase